MLAGNKGNAKTEEKKEESWTHSTFQIDSFTCSKTHTWGCEFCVFNDRVRQDDRRDSTLRSRRKFVGGAFSHWNNAGMRRDTALGARGSALTPPIHQHASRRKFASSPESRFGSGGAFDPALMQHAEPPKTAGRVAGWLLVSFLWLAFLMLLSLIYSPATQKC